MTAPLWSAREAAAATGGRRLADWQAGGVCIDSRTLQPGDLFVALKGPSFDGHDFAREALDRGAAACVLARLPADVPPSAPVLLVESTFDALWDLGRAARARSRAKIIGVTGSVGKTGIKEALRLVLEGQAPTVANDGSLNNHWGLPLSLARMPAETAYGVFEMGMNHAGELTLLSQLARPRVAVITTVEAVHAGNFPSVEAIADAKAEIFAGLETEGAAVLYADNPHFARLAGAAERSGCSRIIAFGTGSRCDVRLLTAEATADGARVRADVAGLLVDYRLAVAGSHWVSNSLCVLAAAAAVGADVAAAAASLVRFRLPKGRGQRFALGLPGGGALTLIDESYNASPVAMAAAFEVLGRMQPGAGGRRIAVLGDMLELGESAAERHRGLAEPLQQHGIGLVFACGREMARLFAALPPAMQGAHAADSAALAPVVAAAVRSGDVVTVKGSAGSRMGRVVDALKALAPGEATAVARAAGGGKG
jgi:UDP-N-acetylmuramoyl-tripeptide--D-alanyl-D-alanine ligase